MNSLQTVFLDGSNITNSVECFTGLIGVSYYFLIMNFAEFPPLWSVSPPFPTHVCSQKQIVLRSYSLDIWMFLVNFFNNVPNKWHHICHEGRANLASLESIIIILSCSEVDIYKVFAKLLFWVHLCSYVSPEFLLCVWSQNLATIINHHHPLQSDDVHSTS